MILLGVIVGMLIPQWGEMAWLRIIIKLALLPLIMGVGYEFIRFAGKHPNPVTDALSIPGLLVQRITTKEPDEGMLEVAITSLKGALRDDYPEFLEFYNAKPWEPTPPAEEAKNEENSNVETESTTTEEKAETSAKEAVEETEKENNDA